MGRRSKNTKTLKLSLRQKQTEWKWLVLYLCFETGNRAACYKKLKKKKTRKVKHKKIPSATLKRHLKRSKINTQRVSGANTCI
jgi:hypothetical protein